MSELHKMKLHDILALDISGCKEVVRVPGGWLYRLWQHSGAPDDYRVTHQTFVPYSDEFKDEDGERTVSELARLREALNNLVSAAREVQICGDSILQGTLYRAIVNAEAALKEVDGE